MSSKITHLMAQYQERHSIKFTINDRKGEMTTSTCFSESQNATSFNLSFIVLISRMNGTFKMLI